jgi:hypothetical protein
MHLEDVRPWQLPRGGYTMSHGYRLEHEMRRNVALALCGAVLIVGAVLSSSAGMGSDLERGLGPIHGETARAAYAQLMAVGCSALSHGLNGPVQTGLDATDVARQCGPEWVNQGNSLSSVSCVSATDCVAVGSVVRLSGEPQTLVESWNGGAWSVAPSPSPGIASFLTGVSCTSADVCVAVGGYYTSSSALTLVESWNGSSWTVVSSPNEQAASELSSVSCTTSTSCEAVGFYSYNAYMFDQPQTLIESWNGAAWSIASSPSPGFSNTLEGVTCPQATACVAVGYVVNASGITSTLVESWNGSVWSVIPSPNVGTYQTSFNGVSCTSPASCIAAGSTGDPSSPSRALVETWDGSTWTVTPGPSTPSGGSGLMGVSCASSSTCQAVGIQVSQSGQNQTLVESWNGGAWSGLPSPTPGALGGSLDGISCTATNHCVAVGSSPNTSNRDLTLIESWDGSSWSVVPSPNVSILIPPVVGMAATPNGDGYWLVDSSGNVTTHGTAVNYGSMGGTVLNAPITHIVATSDGKGYWLVAADGGTFSFGDARFYGSMGGTRLNAPVVDIAPTPDGKGYWLVASDGGVFSFGDAIFAGSMGNRYLNQPVVGIATDNATGGYWLVASDGGIFSFAAPFFGSTGAIVLNQPVVSMASTSDGQGYWFSASDGGVFAYGDAGFYGSMGGQHLNAPVVGMAADNDTGGYWLVASDGGVFSFEAPYLGAG